MSVSLFVKDKNVTSGISLKYSVLELNSGPIIIFTPLTLYNSFAIFKVVVGSALVSLGRISILLSFIEFKANLTEFITDWPILPYSPVTGINKPILIFSADNALKLKLKIKSIEKINLIPVFIS